MIGANAYPRELQLEAERFIRSFTWLREILSVEPELGFAQLGVFRFKLRLMSGAIKDCDVVVGDVSPAFFNCDGLDRPVDAVFSLSSWMGDWLEATRNGSDTTEMMPLYVRESLAAIKPIEKNFKRISARIEFARQHIAMRGMRDRAAWERRRAELEEAWEVAFGGDPWPSSVGYRMELVPVTVLLDSEIADGPKLLEFADRSRRFLTMQNWVREVREIYIYRGFERLAVFFSRVDSLDPKFGDVWTVVGDTPPFGQADDGLMCGTGALWDYVCWLEAWERTIATGARRPDHLLLSADTFRPFPELGTLLPIIREGIRIIKELVLPEHHLLDQEGIPCPFGGTLDEYRDLAEE